MNEPTKPDYRDTVFLPKTEFPMRGNLPQKEPEILARWQSIDLYNRQRDVSRVKPKFILHDGPPYANGNIHIGHALNKILKDVVCRSYQMLGYDAPYVPGWDCHGLPIEWKIEEKYREAGKDKDAVPVLQFRAECRSFAEHWKDVQSDEFQRLGVLGDWAHPYSTMSKKAEAQIVREIHKFLTNGLLYKGIKPVMWSVVEKTALAEAEIEYHDHKSTTLWVKFPIIKTKAPNLNGVSIVIWTTTPWTIPANRAIACHADIEYSLLEIEEVAADSLAISGDKVLIASALLAGFVEQVKIQKYKVASVMKGAQLQGVTCSHPFRARKGCDGYFDYEVPIYCGDFVTVETGTGFVHIAPGHGEDDFNLGRQYDIKFEETVGDDGRYLPNVKGFSGLWVYKPDGTLGDANGAVIKALNEANALLAKKNITHSYPHSWRSKAPLIFRTTPQWFVAMDKVVEGRNQTLRQLAIDAIGKTQWFPSIGENRIRGMIESRPDWCISRQRTWGVPIALFLKKADGQPLKDPVVLSRISEAFDKEGADAWYSHDPQDFLGSSYMAEDYVQVFDIVDVWFESGSTHAFCLNQDLGASEWRNLHWPASLYLEGSDQHRGWFHSSLLEACGTQGRAPFDKVLTHGFTLDEKGLKMSKSLGNVVAPQKIIDQMGADILRLWVLSSDYSQDLRIGNEILKQTGDLYRRFRNTIRYLLGALDGINDIEDVPSQDLPGLERWVLHRLHEIDAIIRSDVVKFDFSHMLIELHDFCNADLSAFYFDVRKDSLYCDRPDRLRRRATRSTMSVILKHLLTWLAPVLSFTVEEAYLQCTDDPSDSIHLQTYPNVPQEWANPVLAHQWQQIRHVRRVVTGAMEKARNEKKIGSSLQAHPHVYLTSEMQEALEGIDFAEICICSSVTLSVGRPPEDAFSLADAPGIGVIVGIAEGGKCERCWQVLPEVANNLEQKYLCKRCEDAVGHLRKAAA